MALEYSTITYLNLQQSTMVCKRPATPAHTQGNQIVTFACSIVPRSTFALWWI